MQNWSIEIKPPKFVSEILSAKFLMRILAVNQKSENAVFGYMSYAKLS